MEKQSLIPKGYPWLLLLTQIAEHLLILLYVPMTPYFVEFLLSPTNEEEIAIYTGWLEFVNRLTNIFSSFIW